MNLVYVRAYGLDNGLDICGDPDDRPNNFHDVYLKQIFWFSMRYSLYC